MASLANFRAYDAKPSSRTLGLGLRVRRRPLGADVPAPPPAVVAAAGAGAGAGGGPTRACAGLASGEVLAEFVGEDEVDEDGEAVHGAVVVPRTVCC